MVGAGRKTEWTYGLDLTRAVAGMLTLSVHFFLNNGFYAEPVTGKSMLLACMVRMLCMTCVPLFMLLTGYLCVNRKWSNAGIWGYYRKLLPILLTYLLSSEVCIVFRMIWLKESYTFQEVLLMFTNYKAAPYAWYIEMYIGLFLLSPFFNAAWNSIGERGQKGLLLTLVGMTALPSVVNQLGPILPDWWVGIYPMTYYAMGAWLREHSIKMKPWKLLLCWLGLAALLGVKGYVTAGEGVYIKIYK